MELHSKPRCRCAGVVLLDGSFLRSARAMWELGVMMDMTASPPTDSTQSPPDTPQKAPLTVVPVVLIEADAVAALYQRHWTPDRREAARVRGMPPATLADMQRLLMLPELCRQVRSKVSPRTM